MIVLITSSNGTFAVLLTSQLRGSPSSGQDRSRIMYAAIELHWLIWAAQVDSEMYTVGADLFVAGIVLSEDTTILVVEY